MLGKRRKIQPKKTSSISKILPLYNIQFGALCLPLSYLETQRFKDPKL
jgi:hypothetical protein